MKDDVRRSTERKKVAKERLNKEDEGKYVIDRRDDNVQDEKWSRGNEQRKPERGTGTTQHTEEQAAHSTQRSRQHTAPKGTAGTKPSKALSRPCTTKNQTVKMTADSRNPYTMNNIQTNIAITNTYHTSLP